MVNTTFLSFPSPYPGNQSDLVLGNYDKFITTIKLHLSGRQNYGHLNLPGGYCTKRNYCFALLQRHTCNNATVVKLRKASGHFVRVKDMASCSDKCSVVTLKKKLELIAILKR